MTRLILTVVLLGVGAAAQDGLWRHLEAPGPLPVVPLARPLAQLPLTLQDWQGIDRPVDDPRLLYGDDRLQRTYHHTRRGTTVEVWMAYSRDGVDRGHHPEICMAVAGKPEDVEARTSLPLEGHPAPVQQYRFGRSGTYQWVYYWHYTLLPPAHDVDQLQRAYQRMRRRPASLTLEVFAPERSASDAELAQAFVGLLDKAVQAHVGPAAIRGSARKPVTLVAPPP